MSTTITANTAPLKRAATERPQRRRVMRTKAVSTRRGEEHEEMIQKKLQRATKSFEMPDSTFMTAGYKPQQVEDPIMDESLNRLRIKQEDIVSIANNEDNSFANLQKSLRQRGCVTNGFLQENLHLYVQHVKSVKGGQAA